MANNHPNTAKGQHRGVEVSIAAWIDLLGYGAMLEKSNFEPFDNNTIEAIRRIDLFHQKIATSCSKTFPSLVLNDGAVLFKDLSPRSKYSTFDFIYRAYKLHSQINGQERANGFPGARMVIATGFRVRRKTTIRKHLMDGIGQHIVNRVNDKSMNINEAVIFSLMTRPVFDLLPELQANFAFSKAYIADSGGSKKGIGGPNCFLDLSIIENEIPSWLQLSNTVDWSDRGLSARFGIVTGMKKQEARQCNFNGLLNAFDIASKISVDPNIIRNLRDSTLGNMRTETT
jgi:hypothetical protein